MNREFFTKIPLVGGLVGAKSESLKSAFVELLISTILSATPIWFFPFIISFTVVGSPGFLSNVATSTAQGELFIYSSALVGPLIFSIMKNYASWGGDDFTFRGHNSRIGKLKLEFPYGIWFVLIAIIICAISAFSFGLLWLINTGIASIPLKDQNLLWGSTGLYLISLMCLFAVTVYRNELDNLSNRDFSGASDFINEWNNRND